jgi:hypothetical protein
MTMQHGLAPRAPPETRTHPDRPRPLDPDEDKLIEEISKLAHAPKTWKRIRVTRPVENHGLLEFWLIAERSDGHVAFHLLHGLLTPVKGVAQVLVGEFESKLKFLESDLRMPLDPVSVGKFDFNPEPLEYTDEPAE